MSFSHAVVILQATDAGAAVLIKLFRTPDISFNIDLGLMSPRTKIFNI